VEMKDAGLEIACEYNSTLFERASMQRLLDDYVAALLRVVRTPDAQLHSFVAQAYVC